MTARYSHRAYAPCSVILSCHSKKNKYYSQGNVITVHKLFLKKFNFNRVQEVSRDLKILPGEGRRRAEAVPNNLEGCTARGAGSTFLIRFVKQARLLYSTVDDLSLSFSLGFTPCPTLFLFVPLPLSHSLAWVGFLWGDVAASTELSDHAEAYMKIKIQKKLNSPFFPDTRLMKITLALRGAISTMIPSTPP